VQGKGPHGRSSNGLGRRLEGGVTIVVGGGATCGDLAEAVGEEQGDGVEPRGEERGQR